MITQAELKRAFTFSPETGVFTRRITLNNSAKKGAISGCLNTIGYMVIRIHKELYLSHRLAWLYTYGEWPNQIDHINQNKSDNRMSNLRNVTPLENGKNHPMKKNNSSGVTGISWDKRCGKWAAYIYANQKRKHLGQSESIFDAVCMRKSAENKYGYHENHGTA